MKLFYTASEVKELLQLGHIRTAQLRIQAMNKELSDKGYWIERGKVPVSFFEEKYPYLKSKEESKQ